MKKAQYTQRGPVPQEFIEAVDFEAPPLTSGQVLIQVLAAPINPSDVLTLTGAYGILPPFPAVGGNEGVGKVVALGPDVTSPAVGQTVLLPVGSGTWLISPGRSEGVPLVLVVRPVRGSPSVPVAAMRVSLGPMGVPWLSRWARMRA